VAARTSHPEADLSSDVIATEIPAANERPLRNAASRRVSVISAAGRPAAAYQLLVDVLATA